ncbi:pyridoxal-phosphate dependent enzyme [Halosimplex salinum]|uniref:pyridoxal-phosphate dependent enzyme n=1 Tax=Halosimplex salinum TaxID=1710538 RepID=UPI000F4A2FDD|nr:pyridoxal-phosphate dependent enzyme [Halosimplex salinum]
MDTTAALDGLACVDCEATHDPTETPRRCPDCGGVLVPTYDHSAVEVTRDSLADERFDGVARFGELLPFATEALVTLDEGTTPLISCPEFADDLGVRAVYVKDEGANPTGTAADRGAALAVTAARAHGAEKVALPTTGDAGQSVAAYAARAGLDSEAFVPTRSTFVAKAMTNVHGGDMSVVEGRYPDAVEAFESAMADDDNADWHSLAPFDSPYRHEGAKTLLFEVVEQLDWEVPDAVVHPTAHGLGVVGSHLAAQQLVGADLADETPALHVAQPEDCAPIVAADDAGDDDTEVWERPDTLVGSLEVDDPEGGALALDAVRDTGGWAVGASDDDALEAAVTLAKEGVEASATGGVGAAAAQELAAGGHLGSDDVVVLVNPVAGNKENDVLRSHLMRKGI